MTFRVYVTDSLKGIYKSFGGEVRTRYYDLIIENRIEESRTADEIIDGIKEKLGKLSEV